MNTRFTMRQTVLSVVAMGGLLLAACGGTSVSTCQLSGSNEVPSVSTTAMGTATATLDGSDLTVTGTFSGLSSDLYEVSGSAAHVHAGAIGVAGDVLFSLTVTTTDKRNGSFTGKKSLNSDEQKTFSSGGLYVNVHSNNNKGGEIRGQFDRVQEQ